MKTARPNGVLNEKYRDYLLGRSDIEPKTSEERGARRYIREHLENAIYDFSILYGEEGHRVPAKDRYAVFGGQPPAEAEEMAGKFMGSDEGEIFKSPPEEIEEGLIDAVAFIYSVARQSGLDANLTVKRGIEKCVGLEMAEYIIPKVLVEIDTAESIERRAVIKIQNGASPDDLTDEEIRVLLESEGGPMTPERVQGFLLGEWEWPPEEMPGETYYPD